MEIIKTETKSINELLQYKSEIESFISGRKTYLDTNLSKMKSYAEKFSRELEGESDTKYSEFQNLYKQMRTNYISNTCLGYDALFSSTPLNTETSLLIPELNNTLRIDLRKASFLNKLQFEFSDDMLTYGECVAKIKYSEHTEKISEKLKVEDEFGNESISIKMNILTSEDVYDIERICPMDFLIDAEDYRRDPVGCVKIIRSYIDPKTLESSNEFDLLTPDDIYDIKQRYSTINRGWGNYNNTTETQQRGITKYEFYGNYIASDGKVFENVLGIMIDNKLASLTFSMINENKIIYTPYAISRTTHRGYSPCINSWKLGNLSNKTINLNLSYLGDILNPIKLFKKGSIDFNLINNLKYKDTRQLELNAVALPDDYPKYWTPPITTFTGFDLIKSLSESTRNTMGLTDYNTGTMGAVRTASEATLLNNATNKRGAVEVLPFSCFIKDVITAFYAIKRNVALADDNDTSIYSRPELKIYIDNLETFTNNYNDYTKIMQILSVPAIGTQLLSNATEEQKIAITRFLAMKAGITDMDKLLELVRTQDQMEA